MTDGPLNGDHADAHNADPKDRNTLDWAESESTWFQHSLNGLKSVGEAAALALAVVDRLSARIRVVVGKYSERTPDRVRAGELVVRWMTGHLALVRAAAERLSDPSLAATVSRDFGEYAEAAVLSTTEQLRAERVKIGEAYVLRRGPWEAADARASAAHLRLVAIAGADGWAKSKAKSDATIPDFETLHPAIRLHHYLNSLHTVCGNASIFTKLAEDRKHLSEVRLKNLDFRADAATMRANAEIRKGGTGADALRALGEIEDAITAPARCNAPPQMIAVMLESLATGQSLCDGAGKALRDGGAKGFDAATQPNAAGQLRSIEIHTKLSLARDVFRGLAMSVNNPGFVMDGDIAAMVELGKWFGHTREELHAVIETKGLDAPVTAQPVLPASEIERAAARGAALALAGADSQRKPESARIRRKPEPSDDAFLTETDVAKAGNVKQSTLRKRLPEWRESHHNNEWHTASNPRPRDPKYTYRWGAIKSLVESIRGTANVTAKKKKTHKRR